MASNMSAQQSHKAETYRGMILVAIGLGMVTFSTYMLTASVQQSRRTSEAVEQTRLLRKELDHDHVWQLHHHALLEHLERLVRASVLRKEALIRGIVKRRYGWTDEEVNAAIESELGNVRDSEGAMIGPEPSPPMTDGAVRDR